MPRTTSSPGQRSRSCGTRAWTTRDVFLRTQSAYDYRLSPHHLSTPT
jgi:hypothetical protein